MFRVQMSAMIAVALGALCCSGERGPFATPDSYVQATVDGEAFGESGLFLPTAELDEDGLQIQYSDVQGNAMLIRIPKISTDCQQGWIEYLEPDDSMAFTNFSSNGPAQINITKITGSHVEGDFKAHVYSSDKSESRRIKNGRFRITLAD